MAISVRKVGVDDDGRLVYGYESDGHVVYTGPVRGPVVCADGTVYETSPDVIEVQSPEHAAEVAHLIAMRHVADGHPTDPGFTYEPPEQFRRRPGKKG